MFGETFIEILDKLSPKEQDKLEKLLKSEFFTINSRVLLLFDILKDKHLQMIPDIDKEGIFKIIYPQEQYQDSKLRLLLSDLLKAVEQYITISKVINDKDYSEMASLRFYKKHNLSKSYIHRLNKVERRLQKSKRKDQSHFEALMDFQLEQYEFLSSQKRNQELAFKDIHQTIDTIYYGRKLRWLCLALSHKMVYNQEYDLQNIELILEKSKELAPDHPMIAVYLSCHAMIVQDTIVDFQLFRDTLSEYISHFDNEELKGLYLLGINFCIRHLNKGEKDFGKIGLELYARALDKGVLLTDGKISRFTYRNVAMMAIRVGDLPWAEEFSESYKSKIAKQYQLSAYHFNLALIRYHDQDHDQSLDHLLHVNFKDPLIQLASKTLQLKLYYELKEWKLLDSHIDSMQVYLVRKKILGYHKQNYKNIIGLVKQIQRSNQYDTKSQAKLRTKIEDANPLTERKWLLGLVS